MEYNRLIDELYDINRSYGCKLGLENSFCLDQLLGNPSKIFDSIHVAGTNGKGSVCWKIAAAFQAAGYRVGLYTSPHINAFRERIRINGICISEEDMVEYLAPLLDIVRQERVPATFFEITTLLAFRYFAVQQVEVAVVEVGLGGRLCATNILQPKLTAITSISYDHCDLLGNTLEEIASEKGGIIKEGIPLVMGPRVPKNYLVSLASDKNAPCYAVEETYSSYDEENSAVAGKCLDLLTLMYRLSSDSIAQGLKVRPPCRFEEIKHEGTTVVFDVAHNPDGLKAFFAELRRKHPSKPIQLVLGLSSNKDIASCMKELPRQGCCLHLVAADSSRAASTQELAAHLPNGEGKSYDSVRQGVEGAMSAAKADGGLVVVCGTFFIMGDARKTLGIDDLCDSRNMNEHFGSLSK